MRWRARAMRGVELDAEPDFRRWWARDLVNLGADLRVARPGQLERGQDGLVAGGERQALVTPTAPHNSSRRLSLQSGDRGGPAACHRVAETTGGLPIARTSPGAHLRLRSRAANLATPAGAPHAPPARPGDSSVNGWVLPKVRSSLRRATRSAAAAHTRTASTSPRPADPAPASGARSGARHRHRGEPPRRGPRASGALIPPPTAPVAASSVVAPAVVSTSVVVYVVDHPSTMIPRTRLS